MILRLITWIIVAIIIYRVLTRFILPVFHITKMTNDRLRKMQQQMDDTNKGESSAPQKKKSVKEGDYIDYEEVK